MTHWSKPDPKRYAPEGFQLGVWARITLGPTDTGRTVQPAGADGPGRWMCVQCGTSFRNNLQATIHVEQGRAGPRHLLAWWSSERNQLEAVDKG